MVNDGWRGPAAVALGVVMAAVGCAGDGRVGAPEAGTTTVPVVRAGPDCDLGRPAVPFRFGGVAVEAPPGTARPVPCARDLGPASESAVVAVTGRGDVAVAPLLAADHPPAPAILDGPALVSVSGDRGVSWRSSPAGEPHGLHVPPWLGADPGMRRLWFATVRHDLCGTVLSWSDDGGERWETNPSVGCPGMGSLKVLEGRPPHGGAVPQGYDHVVYVCANATDFAASVVHCHRSLDGGRSFSPAGGFPDPPVPPGCATRHPARSGAVTSEGVLVFPVLRCGEISAAVSADEGATWRWHHVHDGGVQELHHTSTAADGAGNVYLAWLAGTSPPGAPESPFAADGIQGRGTPVVAVSRDGGVTWSPPRPVAPPGVTDAQRIAVAARGRGQVTVSFFGRADQGAPLDGYVIVSDDLLAPEPLLWGAPVNNPARPLAPGPLSGSFGDRLFYLGNALAPDGTPWAAFHCIGTPGCSGPRSLVLGRLDRGDRRGRATVEERGSAIALRAGSGFRPADGCRGRRRPR